MFEKKLNLTREDIESLKVFGVMTSLALVALGLAFGSALGTAM